MPLFEVVFLENSIVTEKEIVIEEKLILGPITVVASNELNAAVIVMKDNSDLEIDKDKMEVIVRPFY